MTVQSALGENLRAEIDVSNLTPEEAATLHSAIASPEAFRAAGVDFNPALSGAEASLQKRSDGRAVIRIVGSRAVSEPFVDLILNLNWSGGRLQRSYTLLIDPPVTRSPSAPPAPSTSTVLSPVPSRAPAPSRAGAEPAPKPVAAAPRPAPERAPAAAPKSETGGGESYRVRNGDTLSSIAGRHTPSGVSLDQMLVSLYRGNPQAFAGKNMNRLKAGATLALPDAQTAGGISREEARQVIQAQSADFAAFRQRLAQGAPAVKSAEPERQASGKVEAAVQDRKAAASATADQLTLSRSAVKPGAEAKVSKDTERKAAEARVAELSRNVEELKKLSAGTAVAGGGASAPQKPGVAVAANTASTPASAAVAPSAVAPASAAASMPSSVASAVAQTASLPASTPAKRKAPPVAPPAPVQEEGFLASLMDNPIVPVAGISIVALLAGLGVTRLLRRRKQSGGSETSFVESKMQPDSFFGVSGGQRVDTRDGANSSSSSLSYSLSQLDAIGDVDPVAEADVYLAYGRDLQAEEILKEALRADPGRVAIRVKLLEVYAKRADPKSFEIQARQVQEMVGGVGEEWEKAKELGRQVDPANPLYAQVGPITEVDIDTSSEPPPDLRGDPEPAPFAASLAAALPAAPVASSADVQDTQPSVLPPLDLDIDLESASKLTGLESTQPLATASGELPDLPSLEPHGLAETAPEPAADLSLADDLGALPSFEAMPEEPALAVAPATEEEALPQPEVEAVSDSKAMDFDFGDLSLDLGGAAPAAASDEVTTASPPSLDLPDAAPAPAQPAAGETEADFTDSIAFDLEGDQSDPLQRKVELADEFRRIGDVEGARDLLEEVVSKAAEPLRSKAQAMLDELG
ncbi:LysM peptidoglycan-binding domain-containing protein [Ideonella sp. B7]|uniref:FimV/HubP family polar landmark protein n=1 Tax=Ideonella benzenivorans TaxID=2831643 RepID=UPI001CED7D2B|nr:FimV/HubP family polar landmark protein [Ideonella benzenivorans]MCA6216138.1 LysM peptidoglycan-binding domain-containing protein [Ideonella benzenivorans]